MHGARRPLEGATGGALPCRSWFHGSWRPRPEEALLATIAAFAREGLTAARTRTIWVQRGLTVLTFGAIYLVLLKALHLNLILTATTAAGGDMGSHHYVATFLREDCCHGAGDGCHRLVRRIPC